MKDPRAATMQELKAKIKFNAQAAYTDFKIAAQMDHARAVYFERRGHELRMERLSMLWAGSCEQELNQ